MQMLINSNFKICNRNICHSAYRHPSPQHSSSVFIASLRYYIFSEELLCHQKEKATTLLIVGTVIKFPNLKIPKYQCSLPCELSSYVLESIWVMMPPKVGYTI
jgi:hypothetical protein